MIGVLSVTLLKSVAIDKRAFISVYNLSLSASSTFFINSSIIVIDLFSFILWGKPYYKSKISYFWSWKMCTTFLKGRLILSFNSLLLLADKFSFYLLFEYLLIVGLACSTIYTCACCLRFITNVASKFIIEPLLYYQIITISTMKQNISIL